MDRRTSASGPQPAWATEASRQTARISAARCLVDRDCVQSVSKTRRVQTPKRLSPTRESIRRLFALSGNRCAFPDCSHPLIDGHGNFVAEVCHIEAAESGGPRFNAAMNNEQRRLPENLLLLCHGHHVETDDEQRFPATELKRIKERHEAQFEEAVTRIAESAIVDITKQLPVGEPTSLVRFGEVLGWGLSADELRGSLEEMPAYPASPCRSSIADPDPPKSQQDSWVRSRSKSCRFMRHRLPRANRSARSHSGRSHLRLAAA